MIEINEITSEENISHSIFVTYPRTVQISHGTYNNVVDMMNMCTLISQNLNTEEITNVYGGMTKFGFFNDKPEFDRFIKYVVEKHQNTNSFFNKNNWYTKKISFDSWGNEIKKGEYVAQHIHSHYHLILYLTEGAPLILPELKMIIKPKKGSYYVFPPYLLHGVEKVENDDRKRYCLVSNLIERPDWETNTKLNKLSNSK